MICIYCGVSLYSNNIGNHCNKDNCISRCGDEEKPIYLKGNLKKPQSIKNELNYKETK